MTRSSTNMAAQNLSRKRPAPGAEPVGYPQSIQQPAGAYGNTLGPMSNDEFLQWGQVPAQPQNSFQDHTDFNPNPQPFAPNNMPPSNQLARRPMNQIATRPDMNAGQWVAEPNAGPPEAMNGDWDDDIQELEKKAQAAKKEAALKRKDIPPFVKKLWTFVEEPKSDDLIRWTDDGLGFLVIDEDEFAKKLIPELFKHNKYASFVRQLNMYGFHKKVGLTDNSMRASERKNKTPNEYANPYFRRGHYDLMWLIQKPKNVTSNSKGKGRNKHEGEMIEEDDEVNDEVPNDGRSRPRPQLTLGEEPTNSMTQETLVNVQRELQVIRRQQAQISQMMGALKREHEQLYSQAVTFQDQHTRHENSINAILTFLATIYNRNLSGNEGVQGIANMFGTSLPQDTNKSGTVVDVGDYNFDQFPVMNDMNNKPFKKQPLLLTAGSGRATTMSPASTSSPMMQSTRRTPQQPAPNSPQIQEVFDTGNYETSNNNNVNVNTTANNQSLGNRARVNGGRQKQDDMMAMIENTNARNPSPTTPVADFTNVLNDLENSRGNVPLSNTQRENVLRMINNSANQSGDNALVNHSPPTGPANFDRHLATTKADLDALARMQAQQDHSVAKLTNLLQPLSPSGSIPGINDGQVFPDPPPDADDFFRSNDYLNYHNGNGDFDFVGDGSGYNWNNIPTNNDDDDDELFADNNDDSNNNSNAGPSNFNNVNQDYNDPGNFLSIGGENDGGGRVQSIASSEATTPKNGSAGGGADDELNFSGKGDHGRNYGNAEEVTSNKRRRKS